MGYISYKYGKLEEAKYYFEVAVNLRRDSIRRVRKDDNNNYEYVLSKVCHFVSSLMNLARVYDSLDLFDDAMASSYEADVMRDMLQYMSGEDSIDTAELIFIKANIHSTRRSIRKPCIWTNPLQVEIRDIFIRGMKQLFSKEWVGLFLKR